MNYTSIKTVAVSWFSFIILKFLVRRYNGPISYFSNSLCLYAMLLYGNNSKSRFSDFCQNFPILNDSIIVLISGTEYYNATKISAVGR